MIDSFIIHYLRNAVYYRMRELLEQLQLSKSMYKENRTRCSKGRSVLNLGQVVSHFILQQ